MKPFEMSNAFHRIFDPNIPAQPTAFDPQKAAYRAGFKVEELVEFLYAASENDRQTFEALVTSLHQAVDAAKEKVLQKSAENDDPLVGQVDALVDLLYFTYGSFSLMGVDPEPIMKIVHQANMGKVFPDGKPHYHPVTQKVLKPAHWEREFAPEEKILKELQRQASLDD